MGRMATTIVGLMLAGCLGFGLPALGQEPPQLQQANGWSQAAETSFQRGVELYRAGELDRALSLFRGFVVRHYDSPLLPRVYLYLSRIFLAKEEYANALLYVERIPEPERGVEARLVRGVGLVKQGRPEEGMELLLGLQDAPLFDSDRHRLAMGLAEGALQSGRPLQALHFLHSGLPYASDRRPLLERAHRILKEELTDADLAEAAFLFQGTPLGQDATVQTAWRDFRRGDQERARELVETVLYDPTPFPYREDAAALLDRLTGGEWLQRDTLGALIPLTGRYAAFGELVKRGVELALELHNAGSAKEARFVIRDSASDPERSAALVGELANEERVMAILGPLSGAAAEAAARQAERESVPLLTLSPKSGLPALGDHVFRNSLTNRLQARALARYAIEGQGMSSFGVLYPENRLGREMAQLFAEEVKKLGGLVVDQESYPDDVTDFARPIKGLMGIDPDAPEPAEPPPRTEQEQLEDLFLPQEVEFPAVAFDALFIPDFAERVGFIAPQIAYHGIEEVPLLGINGWNSPELLEVAGRHVEGAVFVDGFFRHSRYPFVREFVNLYFETYGEEPSFLEAQAFDAASILLTILGRPEVDSRQDLRRALTELRNYPGVTGATSFDPAGEVDKTLFLLKVEQGHIVQVQ